jgi:hypothetical protein
VVVVVVGLVLRARQANPARALVVVRHGHGGWRTARMKGVGGGGGQEVGERLQAWKRYVSVPSAGVLSGGGKSGATTAPSDGRGGERARRRHAPHAFCSA